MKRLLTLAGCAALALALGACGDSKSPTDSDDILSSATDKDGSSSSTEPESSSSFEIDLPKGARVATLDDLEKNMTLKGLFGRDIYLATGEKHGLFSLWIPDTAWLAAPSDFKDGVLKFSQGAITSIKIDYDAIKSMEKLVEKDSDHSMRFIVNEDDQLQYSLDGGEYKDVGETSVKKNSSVVWNGDSLASKELFCKTGENTFTGYSFYKGRYVATDVVRNDKKNERFSCILVCRILRYPPRQAPDAPAVLQCSCVCAGVGFRELGLQDVDHFGGRCLVHVERIEV